MRKIKGICWLLILAIAVTLMGCAFGGGEVTEPSGTGGTTAPTEVVMQNSGGGSQATEPNETVAPTVENAGDTSEPNFSSESNSTEATTGKSAEPTAGSTESGNTGNTSSGNMSNASTGNTGNTNSGNTSSASSGNSGSTSSGNTSSASSGNTGSTNTGNTGNTSSGSTGSTSSGNTSSTSSGNAGSTSTPAATTPKPTDPPATQPKPTEPAPTSPPAHTHSYTETVVAPTCTAQGYTLHTCACGESYKDTYVDKIPHWMVETERVAATLESEGYVLYTCAYGCGRTETEPIPKLTEYIDTAALEAYGRSYAENNYDFIPQVGTRAGYGPSFPVEIRTMAEGYKYIEEEVDSLAANLLGAHGTTYCYLDVGVEDLGNGYYLIHAYYG